VNQKRLLKIPINKKELATLKEDAFVWSSFLISLSIIALLAGFILLKWNQLPPEIPLFFSRPWGNDQLTPPINLWLLPGFSLLVLISNFFLAITGFKKEVLTRRLLAGNSLLFSLLCGLTIYKIIALVT